MPFSVLFHQASTAEKLLFAPIKCENCELKFTKMRTSCGDSALSRPLTREEAALRPMGKGKQELLQG